MKPFLTTLLLISAFTALVQTQTFAYDNRSDDDEWDDYFMPGVGYKTYLPKNTDALGVYHGLVTEFILYAKAKTSYSGDWGPSRIKTYGNLSIMKSTNEEADDLFFSNFGVNLSFESSIDRKCFIPYFGLEIGGLYQRDFKSFHFTPVCGMQLISTRKLIWSINAGYQYTTRLFDEYSGYNFGSTVNLMLWED